MRKIILIEIIAALVYSVTASLYALAVQNPFSPELGRQPTTERLMIDIDPLSSVYI